MKKRLVMFLPLLALSLTACGPTPSTSGSSSDSTSSGSTSVAPAVTSVKSLHKQNCMTLPHTAIAGLISPCSIHLLV